MAWGALRAAKRHSRAAESPSTSSATLPKEPYVRGGSCSARPSRCSPSPVSEMCTPPKIDGDPLPCALDYRALDCLLFILFFPLSQTVASNPCSCAKACVGALAIVMFVIFSPLSCRWISKFLRDLFDEFLVDFIVCLRQFQACASRASSMSFVVIVRNARVSRIDWVDQDRSRYSGMIVLIRINRVDQE